MAVETPAKQRRGFHVPVWVLVTVGVVVVAGLAFGIARATDDGGHRGFRRFEGGGHGGGIRFVGLLVLIALIAGIGYLIYLAVRHFTNQSHQPAVAVSPTDAAERILGERLARGEIDPDEYRTRLNALRGTA